MYTHTQKDSLGAEMFESKRKNAQVALKHLYISLFIGEQRVLTSFRDVLTARNSSGLTAENVKYGKNWIRVQMGGVKIPDSGYLSPEGSHLFPKNTVDLGSLYPHRRVSGSH